MPVVPVLLNQVPAVITAMFLTLIVGVLLGVINGFLVMKLNITPVIAKRNTGFHALSFRCSR